MILLPKTCLASANMTAEETARFSMCGVRLFQTAAGEEAHFRLEATNGRGLIILRGPSDPEPHELAAMASLPEPTSFEGIVPAEAFERAMKSVAKGKRLMVSLQENEAVLASMDAVYKTPLVEGRYPDVESVLPKRPAVVSLRFNPKLMIDMLRAALAVCDNGETPWVELLYFTKDGPVGVITKGPGGLCFDGLLMPLTV